MNWNNEFIDDSIVLYIPSGVIMVNDEIGEDVVEKIKIQLMRLSLSKHHPSLQKSIYELDNWKLKRQMQKEKRLKRDEERQKMEDEIQRKVDGKECEIITKRVNMALCGYDQDIKFKDVTFFARENDAKRNGSKVWATKRGSLRTYVQHEIDKFKTMHDHLEFMKQFMTGGLMKQPILNGIVDPQLKYSVNANDEFMVSYNQAFMTYGYEKRAKYLHYHIRRLFQDSKGLYVHGSVNNKKEYIADKGWKRQQNKLIRS